ncbi:PAS domain-containing protein [Pseudanabaena sp. ABRG5-3]|uniref:PAS domain-containing protein n=1 Tax=Pseudanabaena sp. ABRG5-3 TaxID=685565 RepID=UPI000DC7415C|nr:PAS domain-containing protein [Pseudanabaena sp. ABRG5-3]BBC25882.1 two-component hybrid sensor and regulator, histidine kinase [Pseudanabaena sp. ABRG5-3]
MVIGFFLLVESLSILICFLAHISYLENINLVTGVTQQAFSNSANYIFLKTIFFATVLSLITSFGYYLLIQSKIKSIVRITNVAHAISKGNLEVKLPMNQKDDIGYLAIALNQIVNKLKELNYQAVLPNFTDIEYRRSTELLNQLIEVTDEGYVFLDPNGIILKINANLAEILSIPMSESIGINYRDIFPEELSYLITNRRKNSSNSSQFEFSITNHYKFKAVIVNILSKTSVEDNTQFLATMIVVSPITSGKFTSTNIFTQDKISQSYSLQPSNHEDNFNEDNLQKMRVSITSLLGFLKLTRKKLDESIFSNLVYSDNKTKRSAQQIQDNLEVMISEGEQIAKSIVEISAKSLSHQTLLDNRLSKQSVVTVTEFLNNLKVETANLFTQKSNNILWEVNTNTTQITVDDSEIKYILTNLLNQIANNHEFRTVVFHATTIENQVVLNIGKVSSLISRTQIFSIIDHLNSSTLNQEKRTTLSKGMGLMIAQEILQKYGGDISIEWIDSIRERYKFYTITLPIAVSA